MKYIRLLIYLTTLFMILLIGIVSNKSHESYLINKNMNVAHNYPQFALPTPSNVTQVTSVGSVKKVLLAAHKQTGVNVVFVAVSLAPKLQPNGLFHTDATHMFFYTLAEKQSDMVKKLGASTWKINRGTVYSNDPEIKSNTRLPFISNRDYITISSFKKAPNYLDGYYFIDSQSNYDKEQFLNSVRANFNREFNTKFAQVDFEKTPKFPYGATDTFFDLKIVLGLSFILFICLITWYGVLLFQRIKVYASLGLDTSTIMWRTIGRNLTIISILGMILVAFIFRTVALSFFSTAILAIAVGLALLIVTVKIVYWESFKTTKSVYKLKPQFIWAFGILKILLISLTVSIIAPVTSNFASYLEKNQDKSSNLFMNLYPVSVGFDAIEFDKDDHGVQIGIENALYNKITEMGGVISDPEVLDTNLTMGSSFSINSNYLKYNPLVDKNGRRLKISMYERERIVLIPEKYEAQIVNLKKDLDNVYQGKSFKVIYIKNNQKMQTYGVPNVTIPVPRTIFVNTINNSVSGDRPFLSSLDDYHNALKIPTKGTSPQKFYKEILPLLKKYHLEDNLQSIIPENQLPGVVFNATLGGTLVYKLQLSVIFVFSIVIIFYFYQLFSLANGRKIAIHSLNGRSMFAVYWPIIVINVVQIILLIAQVLRIYSIGGVINIIFFSIVDTVVGVLLLRHFKNISVKNLFKE
ncbi:hypothetical protein FHQ08_09645 [Lactobacillus sp. CC-MHH1034]|uniref:hypothetical protein n=1 Tax=Agrilactobacillus fermenti TaxID=2586909 RepID=UPI001E523680|nr:hypothetical protein [Agrilactobacillus fermenti]MCD2256986.1 hypothetical protein [Agrilactobacillus fermenti]